MKRVLSLLAALLTLTIADAQQINEQEAQRKAQKFFDKEKQADAARAVTERKAPMLTLASNGDEFYAFNDEANGGYVVISGDGRMPDVLAYSYSGRFDVDEMPSNMKAWIDGYAEQVAYLRSHPEVRIAKQATAERQNVGPLLTSWFSQWSPYNNKCPKVDGKECPTGCVATAMAQIMHYWQWPKQTTDIIPGYTMGSSKINMPDIPITSIDWDNIQTQYDLSDKQTEAISTLMLLCGTSLHMYYTPSFSAASYADVGYKLSKYFDYDGMWEEVSRKDYESADWEQVIYEELNGRRPVLYSGRYETGGGHSFVVDGYKDGYFHANWGWGGTETWVLMTNSDGWHDFFFQQAAIIGIQPAKTDSPNRYAVLDNGVATLYYDKEMAHRSGTIITQRNDWTEYKKEVTKCVIDPSYSNLRHKDLSNYFYEFSKMESIEGIEYLNTSEARTMENMFYGCSSLTSLDLSTFETDHVGSMSGMFAHCLNLSSLDVSNFKTDRVKDMLDMFNSCFLLQDLDVSGFKTDNVTDMSGMFYFCANVKSLDVSGFRTSKVTDMSRMFRGCSPLRILDVSGFNTDNVTDMNSMFSGCYMLNSLDVSGFNTDKVTDMSNMFERCPHLTTIYASEKWNMSNVSNTNGMFSGSTCLVGGAGTTYNGNHTDGEYGRIDVGPDNPGYLTYKAPKYYTITYIVDGEVYKTYDIEPGATLTPEPQLEGDYMSFEWVGEPETMPAHDVVVTAVFETGIAEIITKEQQGLVRIYSPNGKKLNKLQRGLNIVVMEDGTTRKVVGNTSND